MCKVMSQMPAIRRCHFRRTDMAKKSRGGRMTAAKTRAAKSPGGKGKVRNRPAGANIMKT
jgi:hypothetical protein